LSTRTSEEEDFLFFFFKKKILQNIDICRSLILNEDNKRFSHAMKSTTLPYCN